MKPYSIILNEADNSANINLYGEIVSNRPTDWWTGKPVEGIYIVLGEFLKELDTLEEKSEVTFHINSPGGEVSAGVAIYNRMRQMKARVITVVDGIAASAASIIAQGADAGRRKVATGTLTMVHGSKAFLYGYYNSVDIKKAMSQVKAFDKSISEIYEECTGLSKEKIASMMETTKWMTAQEAVDNGFADEIMDAKEKVVMSLNSDKSLLTVNGIAMPVKGLFNLPDNILADIQVTTGNQTPDVINKNNTGGMQKMTVKELKDTDPDLYDQIRASVLEEAKGSQQEEVDDAVNREITRLKAIDDIADKISDKALVAEAKYGDTKMSAGDLALEALKNMNTTGANMGGQQSFMAMMHKDIEDSGVDGVEPTPNQGSLSAKEQAMKDISDGAKLIAGITD